MRGVERLEEALGGEPLRMNGARRITDPEVQALAALSSALRADYTANDLAWEGSPFAWIRTRPSRQKGGIGEKLVAEWCAARDLDVTRSPDSEADRIIEGVRVEIKFSTLWQSGQYKFQQLRDQNYAIALCLGVGPFSAHCWVLPKAEILDRWNRGDGLRSQHGGQGGVDTAWLAVEAESPAMWLAEFGGSLREGFASLKNYLAVAGGSA